MENEINVIDFREQFFRVSNEIFNMKLNVYEIAVYSLLCRYVNNDTKMCFPSLSKMCEILGIGRTKLVDTINALIEKHALFKESGDRVKSNRYYLLSLNNNKKEKVVLSEDHPSTQPVLEVVLSEDCKKTNIKKTYKKDLLAETATKEIHDNWNQHKIVINRKITTSLINKIKQLLKDYSKEEILESINNYNTILTSSDFYWTHRWNILTFLNRGLEKFLTSSYPFDNYRNNKEQIKPKSVEKKCIKCRISMPSTYPVCHRCGGELT